MFFYNKKNSMKDIKYRIATEADAASLLEIYAPYVEGTAITFEYEVPGLVEFQNRIRNTLKKYPYVIAEIDGQPVGYAYTGPFKTRPAYQWAVETSIYVKQGMHKCGIGAGLYAEIERYSKMQNILNLNACIAYPKQEDEYLNKNSVQFHEHLGYKMVGEFHDCGLKFNRWYNMVWMEKMIGEHKPDPKKVIWFSELNV